MRILIAEDERVSARQLEAVLTSWDYEVVIAREGLAAWKILQEADSPKLAILDWMMPGKSGVDLCREVRQLRREPYTYILLLTEKSGRQDLIEGMNAGADDYLSKPFDPRELEVRLRAGRRVLNLMDEVIASRELLRLQATHDSLTGLLNRSAIRERLTSELARAARENTPVGVIMVDLDHFKQVNDNYGHIAGDTVLSEVARRMKSQMRSYDSCGRYGGEEFLIVLPGCDVQNIRGKAGSLCERIGRSVANTLEGPVTVTASMGAAVYSGVHKLGADELIRAADAALYVAKDSGRNRVELAPIVTPHLLSTSAAHLSSAANI